jgi:hypothetical protein
MLYLDFRSRHVTVGYNVLRNLQVSSLLHTLLLFFCLRQFRLKYNCKSVGSNIDF